MPAPNKESSRRLSQLKSKKNYITYGGILLFFSFWMLFIDSHSWKIHSELNQEIERLEMQKKSLENIIKKDDAAIKQLENKDSLERFAREFYNHKKQNEIIFIIAPKDSLPL